MDVRSLRYFVATAEAGSISRAASRSGVTQPSLSQQMMKLEASLGVALFDRLGRGVALTEAGRALLPRARDILRRVQEAESSLRVDLEEGAGRLAVGAIPTMAPYLVPDLVARLRGEFPKCEIHVREDLTQNLVEEVVDQELDVAIMSAPVEHDLIDLEVVGREPLVVVMPTEHPLRGTGDISLADLRTQPAVTLDEMHCLGGQISEFCLSRGVGKNVVCRMTQIDTLLEFVRLGLGVSIVPEMASVHDRDPGRAYVRFRRGAPTREIALAWRRGRSRSRLARRLAELLTERVQKGSRSTHRGGQAGSPPRGTTR